MYFFDVNACLGLPRCVLPGAVAQPDKLIHRLAETDITRALLWHTAQKDWSIEQGNAQLTSLLDGRDDLLSTWTILPPVTKEVIDDDFFDQLAANKVKALRAFPKAHNYLLNRVVFGQLLDQVAERKLPLLLSHEKDCDWQTIYGLLADYPDLTCVLCDIGVWPATRYIWPLLENYPNVYIEISQLSLMRLGIEKTVQRFGPERLLFGSNFPICSPEAAVLALRHADIGHQAKQRIAYENMERLFSEVQL